MISCTLTFCGQPFVHNVHAEQNKKALLCVVFRMPSFASSMILFGLYAPIYLEIGQTEEQTPH